MPSSIRPTAASCSFLIQPYDLPEWLIGSATRDYLKWTFDEWCGTPGALTADALAEYHRCFDQATIHATCEDYRAGATIDLRDDEADADDQLSCPTLLLWSKAGIGKAYDVAASWRERSSGLSGRALDCGHFIAEERPDETAAELVRFIST